MGSSSSQFGRFLLTGIFNTANGYASVLVLQAITGMPVIANLLGYLFAGAVGYLAHSKFTFRTKTNSSGAVRYGFVLCVSYLINLITLKALLMIIAPVPAQLIAVTIFTVLCYFGQSRLTFSG
ncbi:GtrA family protein [Synechococcus sp. 1G10]|uniref:GtrA family protein n=1 Tax=Synechococcus sp. 1G10 TaxID=2025605 RepID=UPI000B98C11B|nr:GtrA family protein [Synechococcus sp. 1G10]